MKFTPVITPGYQQRRMSEEPSPATDALAIQADYRHLEFKPGLKVARIWLEIPIEKAGEFIAKFGTPDAVSPAKVAIARLNLERS